MKSVKFIFIILMLITQTTLCFAATRLTDAEKTVLTSGTLNSSKTNQASIDDLDTAKVRDILSNSLRFLNQRAKKINLSEENKFLEDFDGNYSGKTTIKQIDLSTYLTQKVEELNNAPFIKANANEACNLIFCNKDLQCDHKAGQFGKLSPKCQKNTDCQSGVCTNEKVCEKQKVCYVPASLDQSCSQNPCLLGSGTACITINTDTNGIGQCIQDGRNKTCKSNVECCSNKCEHGKCVQNKLCKKECSTTKTSREVPNCCEGYFKMPDGKCDSGFYIVPPALRLNLDQNHSMFNAHPIKLQSIATFIINFFISSASASDLSVAQGNLDTAKAASIAARDAYCSTPACATACLLDVTSPACATACAAATDTVSGCGKLNNAITAFNNIATATNPPPCTTDNSGDGAPTTTCTQAYTDAQAAKQAATDALPGLKNAVSDKYAAQAATQLIFNAVNQAATAETNVLNIKDATAGYSEITRKSDIGRCKIDLISDYRLLLQKHRQDQPPTGPVADQAYDSTKSNLFDLEMAMAAFDFVAGGSIDQPDDYFLIDSAKTKSVNKRLHEIAVEHETKRKAIFAKLQTYSDRLTCQCYLIKIETYADKVDTTTKDPFNDNADVSSLGDKQKVVDRVCGPSAEPLSSASDDDKKDYTEGQANRTTLHEFYTRLKNKTPIAAMDDSSGIKAAHFLTVLSGKLAVATETMSADYRHTKSLFDTVNQDYQRTITNNGFKDTQDDAILIKSHQDDSEPCGLGALASSLGSAISSIAMNTLTPFALLNALGITQSSDYCSVLTRQYCTSNSSTGAVIEPPSGSEAQRSLANAAWKGNSTITKPRLERVHTGDHEDTDWYGCVRKHHYSDLYLHMPKNTICTTNGGHVSSSACIKHFVQYDEHIPAEPGPAQDNMYYILDPLIPVSYQAPKTFKIPTHDNVPETLLTYGQPVTAASLYPSETSTSILEFAFQRGKNYLTANPTQPNNWRTDLSAIENVQFFPAFGSTSATDTAGVANSNTFYEANYKTLKDCPAGAATCPGNDNALVNKIKENAKRYALESGLFQLDDPGVKDNLNKFADYAFKFHFILPKQSRYGLVTYEPEVAKVYYETMTNRVLGSAEGVLLDNYFGLAKQTAAYLNFEEHLIKTYPEAPGSIEALAQSERLIQIDSVKKTYQNFLSAITSNTRAPFMEAGNTNLNKMVTTDSTPSSKLPSDVIELTDSMRSATEAVAKYNAHRNAQLSKVAAVQKAAANTTDGAARLALINKAGSNFTSALTSPLSGRGSNFAGASNTSNTVNNYAPAKSNETPAKYNKPNFYAPIDSGSTRNGGSGGSSAESAPTMDPNSDSAKNARILQDAIDARNKSGKDKYNNGDEGQTIFDIITNTYIRNYDKVLIKKDATK